jgi:hypothetical protein
MDIGVVRALALDLNFEVHGVDATVTRPYPNDDPIATRAIWMTVDTVDEAGGPFTRREGIRVMALRRDEVPTVPDGTVVVAPPKQGDDAVRWKVDGTHSVFADHKRVYVVRLEDES